MAIKPTDLKLKTQLELLSGAYELIVELREKGLNLFVIRSLIETIRPPEKEPKKEAEGEKGEEEKEEGEKWSIPHFKLFVPRTVKAFQEHRKEIKVNLIVLYELNNQFKKEKILLTEKLDVMKMLTVQFNQHIIDLKMLLKEGWFQNKKELDILLEQHAILRCKKFFPEVHNAIDRFCNSLPIERALIVSLVFSEPEMKKYLRSEPEEEKIIKEKKEKKESVESKEALPSLKPPTSPTSTQSPKFSPSHRKWLYSYSTFPRLKSPPKKEDATKEDPKKIEKQPVSKILVYVKRTPSPKKFAPFKFKSSFGYKNRTL